MILIVDDNQWMSNLVARVCLGVGLSSEVATNGSEGLEKAMSHPYKMLIVDILMPVINGIEVIATVRTVPGPNIQVPIIAITADASDQRRIEIVKSGATTVLIKPFDVSDLRSWILRCLDIDGDGRSCAHLSGPEK